MKKNDAGNVKEVKDVGVKRAANHKGHPCGPGCQCQTVQPSAVTVAAVVGVTLDNEATSDRISRKTYKLRHYFSRGTKYYSGFLSYILTKPILSSDSAVKV